ncbi:phage repressor protein CI [Enterobacter cloacae]|uniref:phage repressor protein CI n=1 Tax=Enterobacter cloacae TaxID=550 RepID=UPI0034CE7E37
MPTSKYPNEIKINPNRGGKAAIERLVEAYGFTTRQALADHLEVSKSTLANRYMRDTFPADWIIQCALETGFSLKWITFGVGPKNAQTKMGSVIELPYLILKDGNLIENGNSHFDEKITPSTIANPILLKDYSTSINYIISNAKFRVRDGLWLVGIDNELSLRNITKIPNGKINVVNSFTSLQCKEDDISFNFKIIFTITPMDC